MPWTLSKSLLISLAALMFGSARALPAQVEDPLQSGAPVPAGAVAIVDDLVVTAGELVEALYARYGMGEVGLNTANFLLQQRVIEHNMLKRGLVVTDEEIAVEYKKLADQLKSSKEAKRDIQGYLAELGVTEAEFMRQLKLVVALGKMAREDMKEATADGAVLQTQWLRAKTMEGEIEQLPSKLPTTAAARIYGEYITHEDVVKAMIQKLDDKAIGVHVQNLMQAALARRLAKEMGLTITNEDLDRELEASKRVFASKPKFQGLSFEDMLKQETGMSPDAYKTCAQFFTVVAVYKVGMKLVPDEKASEFYEADKAWYGPIAEVRHIFLRGTDDPAYAGKSRTLKEAEAEARKVKERIDQGENFDDLVKLMSDDVRTKFKDGLLDKWTPKQWESKEGIAEAMKTMKVGDVRGPVKSPAGWHVIKLAALEPPPAINEDIVRDIRKRRALEVFQKRWAETKRGVAVRDLWPRLQIRKAAAAESKPAPK